MFYNVKNAYVYTNENKLSQLRLYITRNNVIIRERLFLYFSFFSIIVAVFLKTKKFTKRS